MTTPTYDLIYSNTLSSDSAGISITSLNTLAANYADLVLVIAARTTNTVDYEDITLRFNGLTTSNFPHVQYGVGPSGPYFFQSLNSYARACRAEINSSNDFSIGINHIMDFASTNKNKIILTDIGGNNGPALGIGHMISQWDNQNAITSMEIGTTSAFNIKAGSTFNLYGIRA